MPIEAKLNCLEPSIKTIWHCLKTAVATLCDNMATTLLEQDESYLLEPRARWYCLGDMIWLNTTFWLETFVLRMSLDQLEKDIHSRGIWTDMNKYDVIPTPDGDLILFWCLLCGCIIHRIIEPRVKRYGIVLMLSYSFETDAQLCLSAPGAQPLAAHDARLLKLGSLRSDWLPTRSLTHTFSP